MSNAQDSATKRIGWELPLRLELLAGRIWTSVLIGDAAGLVCALAWLAIMTLLVALVVRSAIYNGGHKRDAN